ncbi:MAG: Lrp/AsnC family transcriptional regulator [Hyphomicrobiaceae bacterium]|nr:MAG: Lrp/AsnC family transcriptional regulator [Hyphomicrobiaceae bacterium]
MMTLEGIEKRLIDGWQRDFPLVQRPYREIAASIHAGENEVIEGLARLGQRGILSRVGATLRPNTVGASTLAALSVAEDRLEEVAAIVSSEAGVNHNYEREHALNLWFVVTGRDQASIRSTLHRVSARTGLPVLELPLERAYVLDLGFPLHGDGAHWSAKERAEAAQLRARTLLQGEPARGVTESERRILVALADGLALSERPFKAVGEAAGLDEDEALQLIAGLIEDGIISRFGLVVRHRPLGYRANAMVVWDIADREVDRIGKRLAAEPGVALCYRRPRRLPSWPYNLFAMLLGKDRGAVLAEVDALTRMAEIGDRPRAVLFSRRSFKQRGASLSA